MCLLAGQGVPFCSLPLRQLLLPDQAFSGVAPEVTPSRRRPALKPHFGQALWLHMGLGPICAHASRPVSSCSAPEKKRRVWCRVSARQFPGWPVTCARVRIGSKPGLNSGQNRVRIRSPAPSLLPGFGSKPGRNRVEIGSKPGRNRVGTGS